MDLDVRSLHTLPPEEVASCIASLVEALSQVNGIYLRRNPNITSLYSSGVKYEETEAWRDVPALIEKRVGDCKSLVAWRLAELRQLGETSLVHVVFYTPRPGESVYHVQLRKANGKIEDPSRFLGMRP